MEKKNAFFEMGEPSGTSDGSSSSGGILRRNNSEGLIRRPLANLPKLLPDLSPSNALKRAESQLEDMKNMWQLNWQFFVAGLVCGSAIAAGLFLGNKAFAGGKGGGTRCYSATLKPSPVKDVSEAVAEFVATAISGEDAGNIRLYRIVAGKVEGRDGYVRDGVRRTRLKECQGWVEYGEVEGEGEGGDIVLQIWFNNA